MDLHNSNFILTRPKVPGLQVSVKRQSEVQVMQIKKRFFQNVTVDML